jgi:protein PhnA
MRLFSGSRGASHAPAVFAKLSPRRARAFRSHGEIIKAGLGRSTGLPRLLGQAGEKTMSETRDSNGAILNEGDNVTVIKDLKVKGSSTVLKRGTMIRGIHLTDDPEEIEGRTDKVKGLVLKTCFLKKS